MNCDDFRELLDEGPDAERQARMFAHAAQCPACRARLEFESLLHRQLRTLPVPSPRPGFEQRVLANAHRAQRSTQAPALRRRGAVLAAAAALLVAVGVWLVRAPQPEATPVASVAVAPPLQVQPVRLVFRSPRALAGVTIDLGLPEGVELAGYPGQRQLRWQTDLQSGPNLLELPVLVRGRGGVLTATLNLGDEQRKFSVQVQPKAAPREVTPHA